jgi:hypothetical protein
VTSDAPQEPILRSDSREISLLVADENYSLTYASRAAGERVTDPHVHRHTEAFYVLDGSSIVEWFRCSFHSLELVQSRQTISLRSRSMRTPRAPQST